MGAASVAERARLGRLMAVNAWHAFHRRLTYYSASWDAFALFDRAELTLVPQDIRTADPTIADDIYEGRFAFAGEVIVERTDSPFIIIPPNDDWAEELHSFSWLRHLRASERALAQVNAQALILDWIEQVKLTDNHAWLPDVMSRRILAWISQAPLILTDCDRVFYHKFMRSLSRQVRYLRKSINNVPDGTQRIEAAISLAAASIAISNQNRFRRPSLRRLDQELNRQILPDGGHFSRNPGPIIEILLDLIPLRQTILAAQLVPSQVLMNAIDRMIPMMRFFQTGVGSFARFNGMGATPVDSVAAILAHDDARGLPPFNASHSGYQRLQSGQTILIMDTGTPPPVAVSNDAHAGCLSFEMSSGNRPIIVNCGIPNRRQLQLRQLARTTAAHSTVTIGNASSCRFAALTRYTAVHGVPILSGPTQVEVDREDLDGIAAVAAKHDGYKRDTNLIHERTIRISGEGTLVEGSDSLLPASQRQSAAQNYTARFHLHPFVKPGPVEAGGMVRLTIRGGQVWQFAAPGCEIKVEPSVYLSDVIGTLQSHQIVINGNTDNRKSITWRLERMLDQEGLLDLSLPLEDEILPEAPQQDDGGEAADRTRVDATSAVAAAALASGYAEDEDATLPEQDLESERTIPGDEIDAPEAGDDATETETANAEDLISEGKPEDDGAPDTLVTDEPAVDDDGGLDPQHDDEPQVDDDGADASATEEEEPEDPTTDDAHSDTDIEPEDSAPVEENVPDENPAEDDIREASAPDDMEAALAAVEDALLDLESRHEYDSESEPDGSGDGSEEDEPSERRGPVDLAAALTAVEDALLDLEINPETPATDEQDAATDPSTDNETTDTPEDDHAPDEAASPQDDETDEQGEADEAAASEQDSADENQPATWQGLLGDSPEIDALETAIEPSDTDDRTEEAGERAEGPEDYTDGGLLFGDDEPQEKSGDDDAEPTSDRDSQDASADAADPEDRDHPAEQDPGDGEESAGSDSEDQDAKSDEADEPDTDTDDRNRPRD